MEAAAELWEKLLTDSDRFIGKKLSFALWH